jgi:hypothetical protein
MYPQIHYRVHKSPPLVPILSQINPVNTTQSYLRSILILSTHLQLGLPSDLFPSGLPTNILHEFLFSHFVLHALPISSSLTSYEAPNRHVTLYNKSLGNIYKCINSKEQKWSSRLNEETCDPRRTGMGKSWSSLYDTHKTSQLYSLLSTTLVVLEEQKEYESFRSVVLESVEIRSVFPNAFMITNTILL